MGKRETRSEKNGRFLAAIINDFFNTIPRTLRRAYIARFREEIETYSTQPRRKGAPRNDGCVHELEGYDHPDTSDPVCTARTIKEELHRHYQKQSTSKEKDAFLRALRED